MSTKKHEAPAETDEKITSDTTPQPKEELIQEKKPKEKKSNSKRKWYWIIIILLVIVLAAVVASGIVHSQKKTSSVSQKKAAASTTQTTKEDVTTPGSPLTYSDFSFGGRTVKGYTNFIDLCEKEGGSHNYYFDEDSEACRKANRGIAFDDFFAWEDPEENPYAEFSDNKIFNQFGETESIDCNNNLPAFLSDYVTEYIYKYVYQYQRGKRTYTKTFYYGITPKGGADSLIGIEYTVS